MSVEYRLLIELLFVFVALIVWGLVYPLIIWTDILKDKSGGSKGLWKKIFWSMMIVIFAPISAPIWAVLYSSEKWKKWAGIVGCCAMVAVGIWCNKLSTTIISQMRELPQTLLASLQYQADVPENLKSQTQENLKTLQQELGKSDLWSFYQLSVNYRLVVLLLKMNEKGLSHRQVQKWIFLFENRKALDPLTFDTDTELQR